MTTRDEAIAQRDAQIAQLTDDLTAQKTIANFESQTESMRMAGASIFSEKEWAFVEFGLSLLAEKEKNRKREKEEKLSKVGVGRKPEGEAAKLAREEEIENRRAGLLAEIEAIAQKIKAIDTLLTKMAESRGDRATPAKDRQPQ